MENITIKPTKELKQISELLGMKESEVVEQILKIGSKKGNIVDDVCCVGERLVDQFIGYGINSTEAVAVYLLGSFEEEVVRLVEKLTMWGVYDCPNCGCYAESSDENQYRSSNDNLTPPEIIGDEIFVCTNCNARFIK